MPSERYRAARRALRTGAASELPESPMVDQLAHHLLVERLRARSAAAAGPVAIAALEPAAFPQQALPPAVEQLPASE